MTGLATGPERRGLRRAPCVARQANSLAGALCAGRNASHAVASDERRATSDESAATAGLYVHVPVCRSKCRYCGFYSIAAGGIDARRLVNGLLRELGRYDGMEFRTAYVGGGSPTALPADELIRLVRAVRERCPRAEEFTVECNPGQVDARLLGELRAAGANRLSFGAQSFGARELELLGRTHSVEQIEAAVAMARRAGFENVGLDLIFAIPGSILADWQASVEAAIALNIEHVSAYSLSFEAGTVFEGWRRTGRLEAVDEELDRTMYEWTIERLERAGLGQYEISNFARAGFECRHNLGYWANRPYGGIGPAAASYLTSDVVPECGGLRQDGCDDLFAGRASPHDLRDPRRTSLAAGCGERGRRITNDADVERYLVAVESGRAAPGAVEWVSEDDMVCETAVLNLRRRMGIDPAEFRRRTGRDAMEIFAEPIGRYREMGLIEVTGRAVRLTRRALPIADTILCDFAALD